MPTHEEATCDMVERRLLRWAAWRKGGRSADGYPTKNVLHPSWTPPSAGQTPTMTVTCNNDDAERHIDHCIRQLRPKLFDAVVSRYLLRETIEQQVERAGCTAEGVRKRIQTAKALLASELSP